jgi:hypothetical protein
VCEVVEVLFKYLDLVRAPGGINEQVGQSGLAGCMNDRKGAGGGGDAGECVEVVADQVVVVHVPGGNNQQVWWL